MYLKSTPEELSNDMSHDAPCWHSKNYRVMIFGKNPSEAGISREPIKEKLRKNVLYKLH